MDKCQIHSRFHTNDSMSHSTQMYIVHTIITEDVNIKGDFTNFTRNDDIYEIYMEIHFNSNMNIKGTLVVEGEAQG